MKHLFAGAALGIAVSLIASAPALAAPPESAESTFETQDCGFPVQVTTSGKVKYIEHGDQLITIGPAQKAVLTNIATGESTSVNVTGTFHEQVLSSGDLVGTATGHNVFGGLGIEGLLYTTGNVSYTVDVDTGTVTITGQRARIVNLCDALA